MISSDAKIFDEHSEVRKRISDYGKHFESLRVIVPSAALRDEVKISENIIAHPAHSANKLIALWRAYRLGKKILRSGGDWVITSQDPFEHGMIANALAEEFQLPLQLQVHTDFLNPFFISESLKNRLRVWIAKIILPEADGVRVVSPHLRDALTKAGLVDSGRINTLPIFTDLEAIKKTNPDLDFIRRHGNGDFIILMASRLTREKNISLAIEAMRMLSPKYPGARLVITGDGPESEALKYKAASFGLKNAVFFEPYTDRLASHMKSAHCFLMTSNYEGYGRSAVEAAAAGLPVVMTNTGVALGAVFPPGDKHALVNILEKMITDARYRSSTTDLQEKFLQTLPASWELYVHSYVDSLNLHYFDRLLFITQKVDLDDDVLGVYHSWIAKLAGVFKKISVITLLKGRVELPGSIAIHSLGKESGRNLLKYIFRFYKNLWRLRGQYDVVLVHMNAEYMLLAGLLWKLSGKKVLFWYNHPQGNWKARLGFALADSILHTSPFAFSANRRKSVRMPVGIDTEAFRSDAAIPRKQNSILCLGRISPIKYIETLIEAASILDKRNIDFSVTIAGAPSKDSERPYAESLKEQAKALVEKGRVVFRGAVPNYETPGIYNSHMIYANMTPTGSFDKAILEAMACELAVVASNKAVSDALPASLRFEERDAVSLASALEHALGLSHEERKRIGLEMRRYVTEAHDLGTLVKRVREMLK